MYSVPIAHFSGLFLGGGAAALLVRRVPFVTAQPPLPKAICFGTAFVTVGFACSFIVSPYHSTLMHMLHAQTPLGAEARKLYAAHYLDDDNIHQGGDSDIVSGWKK